jgi:hypothetical protein
MDKELVLAVENGEKGCDTLLLLLVIASGAILYCSTAWMCGG